MFLFKIAPCTEFSNKQDMFLCKPLLQRNTMVMCVYIVHKDNTSTACPSINWLCSSFSPIVRHETHFWSEMSSTLIKGQLFKALILSTNFYLISNWNPFGILFSIYNTIKDNIKIALDWWFCISCDWFEDE